MKIIGTDVSLNVCKNVGYLMMQFDARKPFQADREVRLFSYYPDYCISESPELKGVYLQNTIMDANDVWRIYLSNQKGIDSCCGITHEFPKDYYDLLWLASDVSSYCGLN